MGALATMMRGAATNPFTLAAAAAAAVVIPFIKAAKSAEQFNRAMRGSLAIMGELSTVMTEDMERAAIKAASQTVYSTAEMAKGYYYLASAGLSAQQSIKGLPVAAKFAQAGMFDLSLAVDLLTDAQSALGLTVKDADENLRNMLYVSDALVKANTLSNASVQQFSEALTNKAAAAMRLYNISLEDGLAVMSAFATQGVKGADAGTKFHIVLRELTNKSLDSADAFEKWGVRVWDSAGKLRRVQYILKDLERALDRLSPRRKTGALLEMGFTAKSISALQQLLGFSEQITKQSKQLEEAAGFTGRVSDKQRTPWQKAGAQWDPLWTEMGKISQPASDAFARRTENILTMFRLALSPWSGMLKGYASDTDGIADNMERAAKAAKGISDSGRGRGWFRPQPGDYHDPFYGPKQRRKILPSGRLGQQLRLAIRDAPLLDRKAYGELQQQYASPREMYEQGIARLNAVLDYGRHDPELYARAFKGLNEEFDSASGKTERLNAAIDKMADIEARAADILEDTLSPMELFGKRLAELTEIYKASWGHPWEMTRVTFDKAAAQLRSRIMDSTGARIPQMTGATDLSTTAVFGVQGRGKKQQVTDPVQHKYLQEIRDAVKANSGTMAITP
jgi:TP901 family phage tail tape measure protein